MTPFWLLYYFNLALQCDIPILEVLWILSDRLTHEAVRVFPRIKYQLSRWNYFRETYGDFSWWSNTQLGGFKRIDLHLPFTFNISSNGSTQSSHNYTVATSYPRNLYVDDYFLAGVPGKTIYDTRQQWFLALLQTLQIEEEPADFILDFTDTTPRKLWVTERTKRPNWIEIQ